MRRTAGICKASVKLNPKSTCKSCFGHLKPWNCLQNVSADCRVTVRNQIAGQHNNIRPVKLKYADIIGPSVNIGECQHAQVRHDSIYLPFTMWSG